MAPLVDIIQFWGVALMLMVAEVVWLSVTMLGLLD
jgi:hypothetical protein